MLGSPGLSIFWHTDACPLPLILPSVVVTIKIFSKHRPSGPMLSISQFVRPSVRLYVCPSVCLFTFEVPFNGLFAPTSRSQMFNIFRDSESLGKSNWKKWSQIWTFLFENCLKLPRKKKIFFTFFTFEVPFNGLFAPTSWSRMSNIFRDSESLGKSNGKKWSHIWTYLFENCQKSPRKKKFFFADFALQNMVETTLPNGLETSGRRAYR